MPHIRGQTAPRNGSDSEGERQLVFLAGGREEVHPTVAPIVNLGTAGRGEV